MVTPLIEGRLIIYRRKDTTSNNFYARATFPPKPGYKVFSTKTTNQNDAANIARNRYYELAGRQALNLSNYPKSIQSLMDKFFDHIDRKARRTPGEGDTKYRQIYNRFINPFLKSLPPEMRLNDLNKITQWHIDQYWIWRIGYWERRSLEPEMIKSVYGNNRPKYMSMVRNENTRPAFSTLQVEKHLWSSFFKWSVQHGHILPGKTPEVIVPMKPQDGTNINLRGVFTLDEYVKVREHLRAQCRNPVDSKGRRIITHKFRAERLYAWFMLLASVGMRPGECKQLRFRDITLQMNKADGKKYTRVNIRADISKTLPDGSKKGRKAYSFDNDGCYKRIKKWQTIMRECLGRADDDDFIFPKWVNAADRSKDMKYQIAKMDVPFRMMLNHPDVDIHRDELGRNRSSYALRKFYVTQRIKHNTPLPAIAVNTGHSIQVLWKYYQHIQTDDMFEYLTQRLDSVYAQELTQISGDDDNAP